MPLKHAGSRERVALIISYNSFQTTLANIKIKTNINTIVNIFFYSKHCILNDYFKKSIKLALNKAK